MTEAGLNFKSFIVFDNFFITHSLNLERSKIGGDRYILYMFGDRYILYMFGNRYILYMFGNRYILYMFGNLPFGKLYN